MPDEKYCPFNPTEICPGQCVNNATLGIRRPSVPEGGLFDQLFKRLNEQASQAQEGPAPSVKIGPQMFCFQEVMRRKNAPKTP